MASPLDDLLAATAAWIRWRELATAGLWSLTGAAGLVLIGSLVAGETSRGDLVAPATWTLATATAAALLVRAARRTRRMAGTRHRTAQTISQNLGPLTRGSSAGEADRGLRREILAAVELSEAFAAGAAARGSPDLAAAYVASVAARARACAPALAAPPLRARAPVAALAGLAVLGAILAAAHSTGARGLVLLLAAEDGRPPVPPEPLWSSLRLSLVAPSHAGRPDRAVQNPSGGLRVLAGTRVDLELTTRRPVGVLHAVLVYDPSDALPDPAPERIDLTPKTDANDPAAPTTWTGSLMVRGGGSWRLVADGDPDAAPAFPLELEPDDPPEVELAPQPRSQGEPSERDSIELRFKARDDFGLAQATLVFEGPEGEEIRLDAGPPPSRARTWQHRYTWDLSSVPLAERRELTYWIEVRDNDPGLGLTPLPDPPGKPARSARLRLQLRDEAREHADNLDSLAALRDAAVDLLARRMLADAPGPSGQVASDAVAHPDLDDPALDDLPPEDIAAVRDLLRARELLAASEQLLAGIGAVIDALSVDSLSPPRDALTLTAIHRRLMDLHRREAELHTAVPPGAELLRQLAGPLARLTAVNRQQVTQLEDEIIRIDDLVDDQVVAQIEELVARVQASQQKLIDLLEKLKAGDESVRGEIDQLQQRIREDLRRLAEARARLDKEVGQEFLNLDAFEAMEAKLRQQDVAEQLRQGDVDGALEQARGSLDELRKLRDSIQQRQADEGMADDVPEQDRARVDLLRGLSRLQDDEVGLRSETRALHQQWREQAESTPLDAKLAKNLAQKAGDLRKQLEAINDARLGRDGRRALEDAREQLQHLEAEAGNDPARALRAHEAAQQAVRALQRAAAGAGDPSPERRALEQAGKDAQRLLDRLAEQVPAPEAGLGDGEKARFDAAAQRQQNLRAQAQQLLDSPGAEKLPDAGKQALREALEHMSGSTRSLGERRGGPAGDQQSDAVSAIQRALDSLRQSAPPPGGASHEQASTETERDRSLRDELMDAMKEGAPAGFGREVERYYEELLR
ncbi:MAG: hypothetical protein JNL82_14770 [Myxococcales bacterium]|nr:hypothetical protein [Myxococcales bacterium]